MDLIADYPERAMAYIGLFMMEASVQQAGSAPELWRICVVIWQRKESHRAALLGEGQPAGRAFLEKNQFVPIRETQSMSGQTVVLAERRLK